MQQIMSGISKIRSMIKQVIKKVKQSKLATYSEIEELDKLLKEQEAKKNSIDSLFDDNNIWKFR
jgi:cell shape-determining protein MreC